MHGKKDLNKIKSFLPIWYNKMKNTEELKNKMKKTKILEQNAEHWFYNLGMDFPGKPWIPEVKMGKTGLQKAQGCRF